MRICAARSPSENLYSAAARLLITFHVQPTAMGSPAFRLLLVVLWVVAHEETVLANKNTPKCKDRSYLHNCFKKLPHILEKNEIKGIPSSKEDVNAYCSASIIGMGCMYYYARNCLTREDRRILEADVAGARQTFKDLCEEPVFQAKYLQYTSCYKAIDKDWIKCVNRFHYLFREEVSRKNYTMESTLELCCARRGFLRCVSIASTMKCKRDADQFVTKIAGTLSNTRVYSKHCRHVNVVCRGEGDVSLLRFLLLLLLIPLPLLVVCILAWSCFK